VSSVNYQPYEPQQPQAQQPPPHTPRRFKLTKFRILLLAALCGALVHQVRHWNDPPKPSSFDPLTSKGSLYETLERSRKTSSGHSSPGNSLSPPSLIPRPKEQELPSVVPLFDAAQKGDTAKIQALLKSGLPVNARDNQRRTPLMIAAYHGQTNVCEQLIAAKASIALQDRAGFSPLDYAAARGQTQLVALLLQHKGGSDSKKHSEYAALMAASLTGEVAQLPKSLPRDVLDRVSVDDKSPLHIVAGNGAALVTAALLSAGANPNIENSQSQTPLHWAAWNGRTETAAMLLDRKANINAQDRAGNTPLHLAIKAKQGALAELLMTRGASTNVVNQQGETAERMLLENKKQ
jgi:ankyrin repeat protein